ncbi:hypothetical protein HKD37_06G016858 [Glycine soja]
MKNVKDTIFLEILKDSMDLKIVQGDDIQDDEDSKFSKIVQDSIDVEIVKDFIDTKYDEDSIFSKIVQDSMDLEVVQDSIDVEDEDSIDAEDEDSIDVTSKQKPVLDIYLNLLVDCGFDLNKFPNDDDESLDEKGLKAEVRDVMKIYLPKFY